MRRPLDSELPPELRDELLRSRRAGHDYDALAKLPQLRAALGAAQTHSDGPSAEHGPASHASPAATGSALVPAAWKLVLLAVTLGASVFVAWPALRRDATPTRPKPAEQHAQPPAPPPPAVHESEPAAAAAEPTAREPSANEAAPSQPAPSSAPPVGSSRREIAQLVRIRALLERDPAAAYRLARQSEREFPHGVLSEERQALQVLALAKSGATEDAQRKAQEFFARYPQSPMRERLEAALQK